MKEIFIPPQDFCDEMKKILKNDYENFLKTYSQAPYRGISINTLKISAEKLILLLQTEIKKAPFYKNGYYIPHDEQGIGNNPLHHAGAYYVQEPSASAPVSLLDVKEGEKILDLCAAPGGKSAQIAALLNHTGLLWSNEVVKSRSQILLSNLERMGARNFVVSSCSPDVLCEKLSGFFDKVLVDAPCSGEGMFRKNNAAALEWNREHVKACAERQLEILKSASKSVKTGGVLVYSTCTFSYEENIGVIENFLKQNGDFAVDDISPSFGRACDIGGSRIITPLEGGEGQFAVRLLKKSGFDAAAEQFIYGKSKINKPLVKDFLADILCQNINGNIEAIGDRIYIFPDMLPSLSSLGVIRCGVFVGEIKKNRIEPSHALFSSFEKKYFNRNLDLTLDDERISRFLRGEEVDCDAKNGYTLLSVEGVSLGFGKCSNGRLKNKYPKGLRILT